MNADHMEQEYKWCLPREQMAALAEFLHSLPERRGHATQHMEAVYYDTADSLVYRHGAALRLRRENGSSICCMKRTVRRSGAMAQREEYEVEAETVYEGLHRLPSVGAPAEFCDMLTDQQFHALAHTDFIRQGYLLEFPAFTAELAVDVGQLGGETCMVPFEEIELERKSGNPDAFSAWAEALQARFSLEPQPLSKLARAIAAANGEKQ